MKKFLASLAALSVILAIAAGSARAADGGIRIDQAWGRATPGLAKTGAFYLSITNTGAAPDRLVATSTPVADKAELHETKMVNGVMEMRPLPALTIAPGQTVTLAPGGDHIMLTGLKAPLKLGDSVPLTLTFDHAGTQKVSVAIGKAGASGMPGMSTMPGMN